MTKRLFIFCCSLFTTSLFVSAQSLNGHTEVIPGGVPSVAQLGSSSLRSITCGTDTLLYPIDKATTAQVYTLVGDGGGGSYGEGFSQWYNAPGPVTIRGVQFYGRGVSTTVPVTVSIYTANPSDSTPGSLLTSASVQLTVTTLALAAMERTVIFNNPVTVTGPYVVVVEGSSSNSDQFQLGTNGQGDGQLERLASVRLLGALWLNTVDIYINGDIDFLAFPIVDYNINANFTTSTGCPGDLISFTNGSSPFFSDRFYNFAATLGLERFSYTWNFDDGTPQVNAIDTTHAFASSGSYDVHLLDTLYGWTVTCPVDTIITVNIGSVLSVTGNDITCNGANDGTADLTVVSGNAPFTYVWSNGTTTEDLSGLAGGTYTVVVTNDDGCEDSITVTINEPAVLLLNANITNETNGNDGAVDLTVSGGTQPYTFIWDNGSTTEDISGLAAGPYSVTVTDANGCTETGTFTVTTTPLSVDNAENEKLRVFPNPASNVMNITIPGFSQTATMKIIDITGKVVMQVLVNSPSSNWDISSLTAGNYMVTIENDGRSFTQRLVVLQ